MAEDRFNQWCIVELFGHTRLAGLLTEARWPPGFAVLEVPGDDKHPPTTHFYNPSAFFGLHPVTEEVARKVCASCRPEVVHPWEMPSRPALPAGPRECDECGDTDCNGDCVEEDVTGDEQAADDARMAAGSGAPLAVLTPSGASAAFSHGADDDDKKPRNPGCACHQEEGDLPCPVHGEEEEPAPIPTAKWTAPADWPRKPEVPGMIPCDECDTTGKARDGQAGCPQCGGSGYWLPF
jgi:hypothetical protein